MNPPSGSPPYPYFPLPEQGQVDLATKPGGGAYYARVSQTQTDVPNENGPRAFWRLEGFAKAWFDENPPPSDEPTWQDPLKLSRYYLEAPIFLLELEVIPDHLGRFAPLGLINEFAERDDEPKEWFLVTAGGPRNGRPIQAIVPMTVFPSLYQEGIALTLENIDNVAEAPREQLDKAVSTNHVADAEDAEITRILRTFASSIDWSIVYDVGQGNSIGLCDCTGTVRGYFDIGGGVGPNLSTFPTALTIFCFTQSPPIILSHWDEDHWSSANHTRGRGALSNEWIVPRQILTPGHVALLAAIAGAGGKVWFLPSTFVGKWFGQIYLELCTGSGRNHSGIALTLSEHPNGSGQHILMPGDADYQHIPSFVGGTQYLSVVVPHHGGKLKSTTFPTCPGRQSSRLVYSAGPGNTYGHPHPATRLAHHGVGWHDPSVSCVAPIRVRETSDRSSAGLGHVLLGWTPHFSAPPLPCGAKFCQLEAQSHQL